ASLRANRADNFRAAQESPAPSRTSPPRNAAADAPAPLHRFRSPAARARFARRLLRHPGRRLRASEAAWPPPQTPARKEKENRGEILQTHCTCPRHHKTTSLHGSRTRNPRQVAGLPILRFLTCALFAAAAAALRHAARRDCGLR